MYHKGPGVKKSGPKEHFKYKGKVLEELLKEFDAHPSDPSHAIAEELQGRQVSSLSARRVREIRNERGKRRLPMPSVQVASRHRSQVYIFLVFAISFFFNGLLQNLLPYLMCLLCGCRLNGALNNGDSLLRLNAEKCFEEHNQLEREGRRYKQTLKLILKIALDNGIIKPIIDLSADPTFMIYWGKRMIKRWGTVFSTMYNRALPGLFPLTCFDLNSGLFLWMDDFIGKARRDRRGRIKNLGKVVATKVLKCVDFLQQPRIGIKVRSLTGDEGMTSKHLLNELKKRKIDTCLH